MAANSPEKRVRKERLEFTKLLAQNPNYFGNLPASDLPVVKEMAGNTTFEELTCVGFDPDRDTLEATVAVNLANGYGGDLCSLGSRQWVRFFVDWGGGWEDVGVVGVNVHDLPDGSDCAGDPHKPLTYVLTKELSPNRRRCHTPVLPAVRAVLSWSVVPPADPDWTPVWGNVLDRHIQIKPRRLWLLDVLEVVGQDLDLEVKLPKQIYEVAETPIPLPDPPPLALPQLAQLYTKSHDHEDDSDGGAVEPHRFGFASLAPMMAATALDQSVLLAASSHWQELGIDLAEAVAGLADTKGDVTYEELDCVGLDYNLERLVATIHVKRPSGYSGDLCTPGSTEHVAFWADWDDTCEWTWMGTAEVNVHDIPPPPGGLHYAAVLPVDLTMHRRPCGQPKIARVRAVLSWNTPPEPGNPDGIPHWGNRVDAHVQLRPGPSIDAPQPIIETIAGVAIEQINTLLSPADPNAGLTKPTAMFSADDTPVDSLGRGCPFGGRVLVTGPYFPGHQYRIQVRPQGSAVPQEVIQEFDVDRFGPGTSHQVADPSTKFFTYLDPVTHEENTLAVWTTALEGLWELRLTLRNPADPSADVHTPWHLVRLKNSAPSADIQISSSGDCKDFDQGASVTGDFVARDPYFGSFSLSTHPNTPTIPSNQPTTATVSNTETAPRVPATGQPWTGGDEWSLHTGKPTAMRACGFVVRVEVSDRTVVNSVPSGHHRSSHETGFCLRTPGTH